MKSEAAVDEEGLAIGHVDQFPSCSCLIEYSECVGNCSPVTRGDTSYTTGYNAGLDGGGFAPMVGEVNQLYDEDVSDIDRRWHELQLTHLRAQSDTMTRQRRNKQRLNKLLHRNEEVRLQQAEETGLLEQIEDGLKPDTEVYRSLLKESVEHTKKLEKRQSTAASGQRTRKKKQPPQRASPTRAPRKMGPDDHFLPLVKPRPFRKPKGCDEIPACYWMKPFEPQHLRSSPAPPNQNYFKQTYDNQRKREAARIAKENERLRQWVRTATSRTQFGDKDDSPSRGQSPYRSPSAQLRSSSPQRSSSPSREPKSRGRRKNRNRANSASPSLEPLDRRGRKREWKD